MTIIQVRAGSRHPWSRHAKHVIARTDPDTGEVLEVTCAYQTKVHYHPYGGSICHFCGRPLDWSTFVDDATYQRRRATELERAQRQRSFMVGMRAKLEVRKRMEREEREAERKRREASGYDEADDDDDGQE